MRIALIICLLLSSVSQVISQDYDWWVEKHNWDGHTHWTRYLVISPSYMGPNALPVPPLKNGSFKNQIDFEFASDAHFSSGDKTVNLFTNLFIPLAKNRVGLNINVVPVEYYKLDTITRDLRRSREYDGEGFAGGDFYFGTWIQLVKDKNNLPDLLLTINLKTASGTNLHSARYTDSPGYYFDLSAGKKIMQQHKKINYLKIYSIIGFYVYQTNRTNNFQNDAFLFGLGCEINTTKLIIKNHLAGYRGYIDNGDKPLVYRFIIQSNNTKTTNYKFQLQHGLNDFDFTSIRISALFNLSDVFNFNSSKS